MAIIPRERREGTVNAVKTWEEKQPKTGGGDITWCSPYGYTAELPQNQPTITEKENDCILLACAPRTENQTTEILGHL